MKQTLREIPGPRLHGADVCCPAGAAPVDDVDDGL